MTAVTQPMERNARSCGTVAAVGDSAGQPWPQGDGPEGFPGAMEPNGP